jgi:hypothetical protein
MQEVLVRLALFTALPVALGAALVLFDRSTTGGVRRAEAFLIPLFLVGIGGGGIASFITHVFVSDPAARSLGWPEGSPFQMEAGFAFLAIGLLGAIAAEWRDGFRDATAIAAAVFGLGAAVAHIVDGFDTGGLGLSTVLHVAANLVVPVLLLWFLRLLRRAEAAKPQTIVLRSWIVPVRRGAVAAAAIAGWAFPLGYPTGQMTILAVAGIVVAAVVFWVVVSRAPSHRAQAAE